MKRRESELQAHIKKMSRERLEAFAHYVVISVFGDTDLRGRLLVDSERDRDPNDIVSDVFEDIESCGLHPRDL
jgi:hypothetical protein